MTEQVYKIRLLVDVYYEDTNNIINKETDEDNIISQMQETVLNIVDHAEDEGLLQPDCGVKLLTWHSVVSDPTPDYIDEIPIIKEKL